jgi:hypothetical protein
VSFALTACQTLNAEPVAMGDQDSVSAEVIPPEADPLQALNVIGPDGLPLRTRPASEIEAEALPPPQ